jgi:hypothetical protein
MKPTIAYDVASCPFYSGYQLNPNDVLDIKERTGYLFYDSRLGKSPVLLDGELDCKIVDYSIPKWQQKFKILTRKIRKNSLLNKLKGK